jgi:HAMP domain-containing protein
MQQTLRRRVLERNLFLSITAPWRRFTSSVGFRLLVPIVLLFLAILVLFVGLDLLHEYRALTAAGATRSQTAALWKRTLVLHAVHGLVTVAVFAFFTATVVRRSVTRRIGEILDAIHKFRLGTWRVRMRSDVGDEIDHLAEAFRQLGPYLEDKLATFTLADRKATVARLSVSYERALKPPARRIVALAREMKRREGPSATWTEIEEESMRILAEMGRLGRPDHPSVEHLIGVHAIRTGHETAVTGDSRRSVPHGAV